MTERLPLVHRPTPLWRHDQLDRIVGAEVWVKRDDMTGGAEAGNKLRKLEYLLAEALHQGAHVVVTCGAAQSNHARATAIAARGLGMDSVLLLRTPTPDSPPDATGNLLLDYLVGAEVRFVTHEQYARRDALFAEAVAALSSQGRRPYAIPEGGSNGRGALGYVDAMREVREQLDAGVARGSTRFDLVCSACGSGGTPAGIALGAAAHDVADECHAIAVCDDEATFAAIIDRIVSEARQLDANLPAPARLHVHDAYRGPAYGVASEEQRAFIRDVARATGLVLDPVYTGKALFGLSRMNLPRSARVLFVHTGGLPGLLADPAALGSVAP